MSCWDMYEHVKAGYKHIPPLNNHYNSIPDTIWKNLVYQNKHTFIADISEKLLSRLSIFVLRHLAL